MALKDIWTNKTDGVDDILADDINAIANEVISNTKNKADKTEVDERISVVEQGVSNATYEASTALTKVENKAEQSYVDSAINNLNEKANMAINDINLNINQIDSLWRDKADKADTYTKTETDEMLSVKADKTDIVGLKASHTWQLIGEAELSEDSEKISVDLGSPVTKWYSETMLLIETPVSSSLNSKNGDVTITADKANGTKQCYIFDVSSTAESYGAMNPAWKNRWAVITQWINCKPICTNVSRSRASGRAYSLSAMSSTTFYESATITDAQYITLSAYEWTFPAGTTMKLYGRFGQ